MTVWRLNTVMLRAIVLALILSLTGFAQELPEVETKAKIATQRETALSALVEKQEMRHFELHRFFIPVTQGNLQWLSAQVGAKSEEVLVVWKLMRQWDASRAERLRNPS
jgi:hypothetical protein